MLLRRERNILLKPVCRNFGLPLHEEDLLRKNIHMYHISLLYATRPLKLQAITKASVFENSESIPCLLILSFCCFRWKQGEGGKILQKEGKNILEFVAIKSLNGLEWAIPEV